MRGLPLSFFYWPESARLRLSHLSRPTRNAETRVLWTTKPKRIAEPEEHLCYHRFQIEHRRMKYRVARNCVAKCRQRPSSSRDARAENRRDLLCAYPSSLTTIFLGRFSDGLFVITSGALHAHRRGLCRHSFGCDPVRQIPSVALALDPASFKQTFQNCWCFRKLDRLDPATIS